MRFSVLAKRQREEKFLIVVPRIGKNAPHRATHATQPSAIWMKVRSSHPNPESMGQASSQRFRLPREGWSNASVAAHRGLGTQAMDSSCNSKGCGSLRLASIGLSTIAANLTQLFRSGLTARETRWYLLLRWRILPGGQKCASVMVKSTTSLQES